MGCVEAERGRGRGEWGGKKWLFHVARQGGERGGERERVRDRQTYQQAVRQTEMTKVCIQVSKKKVRARK